MGAVSPPGAGGATDPPETATVPDVCLVVGEFRAQPGGEAALAAVLARYTVLSRNEPGCRNVDLAMAAGEVGRYLVVEKWAGHDALRAHLDGPVALRMAAEARAHLDGPPRLGLYDGLSAHDLA